MKIGIIATHAHALPSPTHTGDSQILIDLCAALADLGHSVRLFAPAGTAPIPGVAVYQVESGPGGGPWEHWCGERWASVLDDCDVVHDFSIGKTIHEARVKAGKPSVSTLLGGCAYRPLPNTVVWSEAMRDRVLRGATDYEGTEWPDKGGPVCGAFTDVRVVAGGVDCDFYSPGPADEVGSHFLWLNRWSAEKGPMQAVELAKATGIELLMVGTPVELLPEAERAECMKAMYAAKDCPNIRFEWLPPDPDHHTAKRDHYRKARSLIYPARFQEPFGLSLVEAMACGCPVIGLTRGSVPEVVGELGWYRETMDDLTELLSLRCGDEPNVSIMAKAMTWLPEEARKLYDRRVMARNYAKLYAEVIGGGGWGS